MKNEISELQTENYGGCIFKPGSYDFLTNSTIRCNSWNNLLGHSKYCESVGRKWKHIYWQEKKILIGFLVSNFQLQATGDKFEIPAAKIQNQTCSQGSVTIGFINK